MLDQDAHYPRRQCTNESRNHDVKAKNPSANGIGHRLHKGRLNHRVAGQETKSKSNETWICPGSRKMRERDDQKRATDQGESDPSFSSPVAQSTEQGIANRTA